VRELVELVRSEVQNLIAKGLKMRKSIF
jgi:hypothetical protein